MFILPLLLSEECLQGKRTNKNARPKFSNSCISYLPIHKWASSYKSGVLLPTSKPKITPYGQQGQTALLPMKLYDSTRTLMIFKKGQ